MEKSNGKIQWKNSMEKFNGKILESSKENSDKQMFFPHIFKHKSKSMKRRTNQDGDIHHYKRVKYSSGYLVPERLCGDVLSLITQYIPKTAERMAKVDSRCMSAFTSNVSTGKCPVSAHFYIRHGRFHGMIPVDVKEVQEFDLAVLQRTSGIRYLETASYFNRPIANILPEGVTNLILGNDFNSELFPLPMTVKVLDMGEEFDIEIKAGDLHEGLNELIVSYNYPYKLPPLPSTLKKLRIKGDYNYELEMDTLPKGLEDLSFEYGSNQSIRLGVLPSSLRNLTFGSTYNKESIQGAIPEGVETVVYGEMFNRNMVRGSLPCTVKKVVFGGHFNKSLPPGSLPEGLTSLELGEYFNVSLTKCRFPKSLIVVRFGARFNKPIFIRSLPDTLEDLSVPGLYNHLLSRKIIPRCLKRLTISRGFTKSLNELPDSLEELTIVGRAVDPPEDDDSDLEKRRVMSLSRVKTMEQCGKERFPVINRLPTSLKMIRFKDNVRLLRSQVTI